MAIKPRGEGPQSIFEQFKELEKQWGNDKYFKEHRGDLAILLAADHIASTISYNFSRLDNMLATRGG